MPTWSELIGTIGPVAAVLVGMWLLDRKQRADSKPKDDPAAKLADEISGIRSAVNDLRSELAELGGFIKGRMK